MHVQVLLALSQISECLPEDPKVHVELTQHVVRFFRHPHPRVRFAAVHCLITFSQDLGPNLQQNTHRLVIPNIVNLIRTESSHPRVQAHAVESLSMFVDMCQDESLMPYLKDLLMVLSQLLQSNVQLQVQSKCVAAVASIADRAGKQFVPFYDNFVPALKSVFFRSARRGGGGGGGGNNSNTHEQDMLSGRCLECITLIGMAVGKERFGRDAIEIMEELVRQKQMILAVTSLKSTGPLASFMLSAWGRIGKCLGKDFAPYLQYVVPALIAVANQPPGHKVTQKEILEYQQNEEDYEDRTLVESAEGQAVMVRTAALEDKAIACRMLACFVADMKDVYNPYVDTTMRILAPLSKDSCFDDIRLASLASLPDMLKIVRLGGVSQHQRLTQLFTFAVKHILEGIQDDLKLSGDELVVEVLMTSIQSLQACLLAVGAKRGECCYCCCYCRRCRCCFTLLVFVRTLLTHYYTTQVQSQLKHAPL